MTSFGMCGAVLMVSEQVPGNDKLESVYPVDSFAEAAAVPRPKAGGQLIFAG